jgi:hypothetical protein
MQSRINPTKDTEGADFAADLERFSEDASTDKPSEEGAADLKRMREEMKVLMELVNQGTTESPLPENKEDSAKLSALVSQCGELNLLRMRNGCQSAKMKSGMPFALERSTVHFMPCSFKNALCGYSLRDTGQRNGCARK